MSRIAWFVPQPIRGSGGHRTIYTAISALRADGHICDVYVHPENPKRPNKNIDLRKILRSYFQAECDQIVNGMSCEGTYDAAIATAWRTAPFVARLNVQHKFYLVQDLEEKFNPVGDASLLANLTYQLGLTPITIGRFLRHYLWTEFQIKSWHCDFSADGKTYRPLPHTKREMAVCFIYQPEKPRRCAYIGLKALKRVKDRLPDVKIYTYGSHAKPKTDLEVNHLGLLSLDECNALYNKCSVGLCLSATNPSRVPFEMMASGLPVIDIYGSNTIFDLPDKAILLAQQEPNAIADAICEILSSPERIQSMSEAGIDFMSSRPEQLEANQFVEAVNEALEGIPAKAPEFKAAYNKAPFHSPDGMDLQFDPRFKTAHKWKALKSALQALFLKWNRLFTQ